MVKEYLSKTYYLDYTDKSIQSIVNQYKTSQLSKQEIAIDLYYKIRDGWRYNPYQISFVKDRYQSSYIASKADGHCIEKSILLISCLRALDIPARLHLAKVKNHIGVEKFIEKFGNDEITPHGMVDIYLNNKWVKVSPAFNKELCLKLNVHTLNFDGEHDSLFHEYDKAGNTFMIYLEDYGYFSDVPLDFIANNFKENYPKIMEMANENGEIRI